MRGKNKRQKTNYNETQSKKKQKQIQTGESKPELTEIQIIENHKVPLSTKNPITIQQHLDLELKYLKTQIKEKESDGVRLKNENNTDRKPKKKINPMVPTIELDLLKALALSGAVSEDNSMKPNKIGFVRCARTDKGVHAGGQVVSFKMILEQDIIEKINNYLPPQIRVWGYARVNNSFSAHTLCDSRIYEYLLPTYCFMEASAIDYPFSNIAIETDMTLEKSGRTLFQPREVIEPTLEEMKLKRQYRITNQKLDKFNSILSKYVGTHNYHNFTVGKSFNDRSAQRYITLCEAGVPFLQDGAEWLSIKIHGQSFMLHQIRKMMGLGIMLMRTNSPLTIFETVFGQERINIPKAPPIGLLLERPIFAYTVSFD
ncbi:tRNA pseudouridine synthase 1 [Globomyces sp. JEL0801]|nr:tRNA pseudouridine synthase 1 [Globomyces sp. JEL0801]